MTDIKPYFNEIRWIAEAICPRCKGTGIHDYQERDPGESMRFGGPPPRMFKRRSLCWCVQSVATEGDEQ